MGWTEEFLVDAYVFGYPLVYNVSSMQAIAAHGLGSMGPAGINRFAHADQVQLARAPRRRCPVLLVAHDVLAAVPAQKCLDQRASGLVILEEAEALELDHCATRARMVAAAAAIRASSVPRLQNCASCAACAAGSASSSL